MKGVVCLALVGAIGCGGKRATTPDGSEQRDAAIDALLDAPIDAPIDAPPDAPLDAPPPPSTCAATAAVLVDVSPRRLANFAISGTTLYASAYDIDPDTQQPTDPVILTLDRMTGASLAAPLVPAGVVNLFDGAGGDVFAVEGGATGTIWKLHPGQAPVALLTARPRLQIATSDATHIYWSEAMGSGDVIRRKAFAASQIEDVMPCDSPLTLDLDAAFVYCTPYGSGGPQRVPKGGGQIVGYTYNGGLISSAVVDGSTLYFTNLGPFPKIWQLPLPAGPITLVKELTTTGNSSGIAVSPTYFYVVDQLALLVRRVHRASLAIETIYSASIPTGKPPKWRPVLAGNRIYFQADNPQLSGPRYVMHCVD